eukprot:g3733.t1
MMMRLLFALALQLPIVAASVKFGTIAIDVQGTFVSAVAVGTKIFMIPNSGLTEMRVGVVDTTTNTFSKIATGLTGGYSSAVVVGTKVYMIPSYEDYVGVVDTTTNAFSKITTGRTGSKLKYSSAVVVGTKVYMIPIYESNVGVVDTTTNGFSTIPSGLTGFPLFQSAAVIGTKIYMLRRYSGRDYPAIIISIDTTTNTFSTAISPSKMKGIAVVIGTKMYIPERLWIQQKNILGVAIVDTTTNTLSHIQTSEIEGHSSIVAVGTKVYIIPTTSSNIGVVDTTTDTFSTIATGISNPYYNSAVVLDTIVYMIPDGETQIVGVLDTTTNTFSTIAVEGSAFLHSIKMKYRCRGAKYVPLENIMKIQYHALCCLVCPTGTTPGNNERCDIIMNPATQLDDGSPEHRPPVENALQSSGNIVDMMSVTIFLACIGTGLLAILMHRFLPTSLVAIDFFAMDHRVEEKHALRMYSTKLGAALTVMFLLSVVGVSIVYVGASNELRTAVNGVGEHPNEVRDIQEFGFLRVALDVEASNCLRETCAVERSNFDLRQKDGESFTFQLSSKQAAFNWSIAYAGWDLGEGRWEGTEIRRVTRDGWVNQVEISFDAITSFYVNTYHDNNVKKGWQHLLWRSTDATFDTNVEPTDQDHEYTVIISITKSPLYVIEKIEDKLTIVTRVSGLISIIMSVMGIFSVVMKYGEIVVDRLLSRKGNVPDDVRRRKSTMVEQFITKGRRMSAMMECNIDKIDEMHIEMKAPQRPISLTSMKSNPMKGSVTRSEFLQKMAAIERELASLKNGVHGTASHVVAHPVKWRKRRSHDYGGQAYYENVEKGTTQWEEPEGADELSTDED